MFKKIKKQKLQDIYLDYLRSKQDGRRCESFVPYAEEYKKQMKVEGLMTTFEAICVVERIFLEEVASRYFGEGRLD